MPGKTRRPILKINSRGEDITKLQAMLRQLDYTINDRPGFFGEDTRDAVMDVQSKHGMRPTGIAGQKVLELIQQQVQSKSISSNKPDGINDGIASNSPSKGETTSDDINKERKGALSFTVEGKVLSEGGNVYKRQKLIAFDLDLRAVGVYRKMKSLNDIRKDGGFEQLGESVYSDVRGHYSVGFYDWQYKNAERKKADVVVYALGNKNEVLGLSRLVNSEDYSDKGLVRDLDVLISLQDNRTEYAKLMSKLTPFLEESDVRLIEIAQSNDQLAFAASELDIELKHVTIAASAELLAYKDLTSYHELFYGLGRQNIRLSWTALYKQKEEQLIQALDAATTSHIIRKPSKKELREFLNAIQSKSTQYILVKDKKDNPNHLSVMLGHILPKVEQQTAFVDAVRDFEGDDFSKFWHEHLPSKAEFKGKPELISGLLLSQQLTMLTGNHQALVAELLSNRKIRSVEHMFELNEKDWLDTIAQSGLPDFVQGKTKQEKERNYVATINNMLTAAFPTQRIAKMLKSKDLPIKPAISGKIRKFIAAHASTDFEQRLQSDKLFDIAGSRIHEFNEEIKLVAGKDAEKVRSELMKIQRVFQVSPTPEAMSTLLDQGLDSAYTIANMPQKVFVNQYKEALGGEEKAFSVHQRALHMNKRAEMSVMHIREYAENTSPKMVISKLEQSKSQAVIEKELERSGAPSYSDLFGSPDLCECKHCRSVYSAAAYFVEILRFLDTPNHTGGETTLEVLEKRRPDLLHLPLTCSNTNTMIPYIDLVNEVMEYYTAHAGLQDYAGYSTGDETVDELRANPQNFNLRAYKELKDAKYPFTLPYHRPLDAMRIYGEHCDTSRYDVLKVMNPNPDESIARAIAAESLQFSPEEYAIIASEDFQGKSDDISVEEYFGYAKSSPLDELSHVPQFLTRSGVAYTDLIKLVKTQFLNPYQIHLDFLQSIFSASSIQGDVLYKKLADIQSGAVKLKDEQEIIQALKQYDANYNPTQFKDWLDSHFDEFKQVVTLYEKDSKCDLGHTYLKTIEGIYKDGSGLEDETFWKKTHRFIRLWRKLDWTIHELDLVLVALGENDITPQTISKLESFTQMHATTKLPLDELAVLWGNIDTYGDTSLYTRLFLNRGVQQENRLVFEADVHGHYLSSAAVSIKDHLSELLAAYSLTEGEFYAILGVVEIGGNNLLDTDTLNLEHISIIYRHVVLAKGLSITVTELCTLIQLFGIEPFSIWNVKQGLFNNILPSHTYDFYRLVIASKAAGFHADLLAYIFQGTIPASSTLGLDQDKLSQTIVSILNGFASVDQEYPETIEELTVDILVAKLSRTLQPEIVNRLTEILQNKAIFEVVVSGKISLDIPEALAKKYNYIEESARFTCYGIMTDTELAELQTLSNNTGFKAAVSALYAAPEEFITENFSDVFSDLNESYATLLERSQTANAISLSQKLHYVYEHFLPRIKPTLQKDTLNQSIANLVGLSKKAVAVLLDGKADDLIATLVDNDTAETIAYLPILDRAAQFILAFEITDSELEHMTTYATDFGNIDFAKLNPEDWQRTNAYSCLRNQLPQSQAYLIDVFKEANRNPQPTVSHLLDKLHLATAWDRKVLGALEGLLGLVPNSLKDEQALIRIQQIIDTMTHADVSLNMMQSWGSADIDFDTLHQTSLQLISAVKSHYSSDAWLDIASGLSDALRENQKQALISYLLVQTDIQNAKVKDADGLFEYFLIDVQMMACMDTSRIVQANAAVQMFIQRCLLNLEENVLPEDIDWECWEWMKNYRVWEANRKVFLYPENWLEPEWRNNRSAFFKDLESHLVQNDITKRSVEEGFRNYLTSLNEVANLDVCAMHQENYKSRDGQEGKLKQLHVFGRTHNAPYKFFYRTWNEYGKWSAWEKVGVDIRCVEDGDNSGVHLVPVVWKDRLFIFWPEFIEKQKDNADMSKSIESMSAQKASSLSPTKYWETRLAWSEYVDGKWNSKQLSKEYVELFPLGLAEKDFLLAPQILPVTHELEITITTNVWWQPGAKFIFSDIQSRAMTKSLKIESYDTFHSNYKYDFSRRESASETLTLKNLTYLRQAAEHKLLPVNTQRGLDISLESPFFFSDAYRTYFVKPLKVDPFSHSTLTVVPNPLLPWADDTIPPVFQPQPVPFDITPAHPIGDGSRRNLRARASSTNMEAAVATRPFTFNIPSIIQPWQNRSTFDDGLEFHTFYHPLSSTFVTRLNQGGIPKLLKSDTELQSDNGTKFQTQYDPDFNHGAVQKPLDFNEKTYYKENVCFESHGANSLYNWELFFHAPLYVATRLSKNGKFEEAMKWFHYIFDPTSDEAPDSDNEIARYWKVLPFKTTPADSLEEWFRQLNKESNPSSLEYNQSSILSDNVSEWKNNPFDPHLVASNRPIAYMKHVVIKYVENLLDWGDSLFRQFTRESVYEALQVYVIANHILGPRPEFVPSTGSVRDETYDTLKDKLDSFSNALVEMENIFPYSGDVSVSEGSEGANLLGAGSALYFGIPANESLIGHWDTVADRLFKIRHCQDIDGVERKLALFSPPIDPAALVQAASQGLSLGSILADIGSPPPLYRFTYLLQKTNEFCGDVKGLGSAMLSALEKKDGEELARLRASHESQMLELMTGIKERQVLSAKASKEALLKSRETAEFRLQHYIDLLGNETISIPSEPTVDASLTSDSQLPSDTAIATIVTDVDEALVERGEAGVKLIAKEKNDLDFRSGAMWSTFIASESEMVASIASLFPTVTADGKPMGVGSGAGFGGQNIAAAASARGKNASLTASLLSQSAGLASSMASYIRREQDWTLQANLAAREIIQLDKQITSTDIQIQVAEKELENHKQQIKNSEDVETFLKDKFTNQELYQWMKEQLLSIYKQSYNLAYDMAKKTEKAYNYELGTQAASFIQYGYWDDAVQGLVSGEKLQLALRQMEKYYIEENRRELELTKSISIALLNPLALIELKETGKCYLSLSEELFDLDFQGHYFRRIKSVSLSIPCIVGTYTSVNCSLRLRNNHVRINTAMASETGSYEHNHDGGLWTDDSRFRSNYAPVTSIATSSGQNDSGLFEFNFRDERYLPFEGAGAISEWEVELSTAKELRQFDYDSVSDVILHVKYTARESSGSFHDSVVSHMVNSLSNQPMMRMFNIKQQFSSEWNKFVQPISDGTSSATMELEITKQHFPFLAQNGAIVIKSIELFSKFDVNGLVLSMPSNTGIEIQVQKSTGEKIGDLFHVSFVVSASLDEVKHFSVKEDNVGMPKSSEEVYLLVNYQIIT